MRADLVEVLHDRSGVEGFVGDFAEAVAGGFVAADLQRRVGHQKRDEVIAGSTIASVPAGLEHLKHGVEERLTRNVFLIEEIRVRAGFRVDNDAGDDLGACGSKMLEILIV